jgi:hypothetical protein
MLRTSIARYCPLAALAAVSFTLTAPIAQAAGDSYSARQDDLQLTADWTWAGCALGGYYPIRIAMKNFGPSREFVVQFRPDENGLPQVSRRVNVDQNATASFSLLIPMVGSASYGNLVVLHNGQPLESLRRHVSLAERDISNIRPGLLVIADTQVDCASLETAVTSVQGHSSHGRHGGTVRTSDHEVIEPFLLPDNWLAYSGLDVVLIRMELLAGLAETQRSALIDWVRSGGTLLVYNVEQPAHESAEFARLVELNGSLQGGGWTTASQHARRVINVIDVDQYNNASSRSGSFDEFTWEDSPDVFAWHAIGFGKVLGFQGDPFSGSVQDWGWVLDAIGSDRLHWTQRHGVAGRAENEEFLQFLIPNNRSVPMAAFLIFISVFTFVIGPFNYYVLAKRGRLNFLVVTIPAIALVTSVVLFAFSAVSHGFGVKSRVRSLTLIDQNSQTAVSTTRLALYAGLAPSEGLSFSPATAVIPIWPGSSEFQNGRVDWTEKQHLSTGWLRSRTRTQFLTINVRPERGRLTIEPGESGSLNVTNGLEWDLEALLVSHDGEFYYGTSLAAGSAKSLQPAVLEQRRAVVTLLNRSQPSMPEDLENSNDVAMFNDFNRRRRYYGARNLFQVSLGQTEQHIQQLHRTLNETNSPPPERQWIAVLREPPGIELGTESTIVDGWHLVLGSY